MNATVEQLQAEVAALKAKVEALEEKLLVMEQAAALRTPDFWCGPYPGAGPTFIPSTSPLPLPFQSPLPYAVITDHSGPTGRRP